MDTLGSQLPNMNEKDAKGSSLDALANEAMAPGSVGSGPNEAMAEAAADQEAAERVAAVQETAKPWVILTEPARPFLGTDARTRFFGEFQKASKLSKTPVWERGPSWLS